MSIPDQPMMRRPMEPQQAPLALPQKPNGRPTVHPLGEILDAIFYIVHSGCAWRLLAHDGFPPWKTVYYHYYFGLWRIDGTWEGMHAALREERAAQVRLGREAYTP